MPDILDNQPPSLLSFPASGRRKVEQTREEIMSRLTSLKKGIAAAGVGAAVLPRSSSCTTKKYIKVQAVIGRTKQQK